MVPTEEPQLWVQLPESYDTEADVSGFYDSVFKAVDLPFIPNVFEPLFHSYVKKFVMGLASAGIDAIVTTFREIGVFLKNKVDSNPYSPETLEVSYVK